MIQYFDIRPINKGSEKQTIIVINNSKAMNGVTKSMRNDKSFVDVCMYVSPE